MTFKLDDAGRSKSSRPKQSRDCTVRALARVLGCRYDRAYQILHDAGRECSKGFDIEEWGRSNTVVAPSGRADARDEQIYWQMHKMGFYQADQWKAAHKGERYGIPKATKRYRLHDFLHDNPKGRFIVATACHVLAVVNGVAYDDVPWHFMENRPVYAWMRATVPLAPLWQIYAVRSIGKRGTLHKRKVALIEGSTYKQAMKAATMDYEWALRGNEDLTVEPFNRVDQGA